ncbi:uncharacterized protein LOC129890332 [Solanum dulcamara]|uniref:uncharacterized protein LOC129890332 n=1 Tax=Solanum dulcamara TaxID=45834 RepID=UPI0024851D99|nr:uncharacterized protein LOC129890332 [Solanum dulcamara]
MALVKMELPTCLHQLFLQQIILIFYFSLQNVQCPCDSLSALCYRCPYLMVSPMDRGMNLTIILLFQIIQKKKMVQKLLLLGLESSGTSIRHQLIRVNANGMKHGNG